MKSYLIDEIGVSDIKRIHGFLTENALPSGVKTVFWVKAPASVLTPLQQEHKSCQPHVFAFETGQGFAKAELYLRTFRDLSCPCQDYCTPQQVRFVIEWVNAMLKDLSIRT